MKMITLKLPDSVDISEQEAKNLFAAKLYEQGSLSLGQAAEIAGYPKRIFAELLGNYGVSIFNYSPADLELEIENAKNRNC